MLFVVVLVPLVASLVASFGLFELFPELFVVFLELSVRFELSFLLRCILLSQVSACCLFRSSRFRPLQLATEFLLAMRQQLETVTANLAARFDWSRFEY